MNRLFHLPGIAPAVIACLCLSSGRALPAGDVPPKAESVSVADSRVIAPSRAYTFANEKYVYSVQWHVFNAGTSTVEIQHVAGGARVTGTAKSAGMPDKFYHVHDLFTADVDPATFCTQQVEKHNEEGQKRYEERIALDYPHGKSKVDLRNVKTSETKHSEFDIPACVTDVISGFFYVASLPLSPGYSQTFPINDNGKTSDIELKVESRETIKSPAGQFDTLRVKAEPRSGPMKGKGVLWVWFSNDARRVPVQMKSKLGFATLLFQLQKIDSQPDGK